MRLHDFIEFQARIDPDAPALRDGTNELSRGEMNGAANQVAHALVASGIPPAGRVAVLADNCLEFFSFIYGAAKAGVTLVPLNTRLAPPEWAYIVNDSEATLLIARGGHVAAIDAIRDDLPNITHYIGLAADLPDQWESFEDWTGSQPADASPDREVSADDAVIQMYTSGTTGRPKGAVLEHGALSANLVQSMLTDTAGATGCGHIVAPLAHIGAALTAMMHLVAGGSVYVQADFDMPEVVRILSEEGVNRTMLVPAMIQALLVFVPDAAEREYPALEQIGYGASPIAPETLRQAMDVFGCRFVQGYGQTESSGGLTALTHEDHLRGLGAKPELLESCGRPMAGTEIRILDEDGNELAPGEVGEIVARGPQIMRGYWNLPEANAAALRDGWLHTGDAGTFDDEGYLYIKDRIKDMVVSGGENVYPAEVEAALIEADAVADCAVIGVPDEKWGEAIKAIVVLVPEKDATEDELIAFCRERLAGFKRPKSIDFVDELPRNASMKVLKNELRKPYWEGHDRAVG